MLPRLLELADKRLCLRRRRRDFRHLPRHAAPLPGKVMITDVATVQLSDGRTQLVQLTLEPGEPACILANDLLDAGAPRGQGGRARTLAAELLDDARVRGVGGGEEVHLGLGDLGEGLALFRDLKELLQLGGDDLDEHGHGLADDLGAATVRLNLAPEKSITL